MDFYKKILMTMLRKCGERDDLLMGFAFLCPSLQNPYLTICAEKRALSVGQAKHLLKTNTGENTSIP